MPPSRRLDPPGLPIYPIYMVVPREAASRDRRRSYIDYIASPRCRRGLSWSGSDGIPGWTPRGCCRSSPKAKELLFKDVTRPGSGEILAADADRGVLHAIRLAYEEIVR